MDRDTNQKKIEQELQAEKACLAEIEELKKRQFELQEAEYELMHKMDVEQENLYQAEHQIDSRERLKEDLKKQGLDMTEHLQNVAVEIFQAGMDFNEHGSVKLTDIQELQAKYQNVGNSNDPTGTIDEKIRTLEDEFLANGPLIEKCEIQERHPEVYQMLLDLAANLL